MQRRRTGLWLLLVLLLWISSQLQAQQQAPTTAPQTGVPRLIKFAGSATSAEGKALSGTVGITFAIYPDQQGGAPQWMETQNVSLDRSGHYTALLGATKPDGLPMDLFTSGEARWLGATMNGGEEQPRVLLLSVPYALQAADAQTLGGLPPSAFMLAPPPSPASNNAPTATTATSGAAPSSAAAATSVTGSGTLDFLPLWTGTTTIGNSALFQSGAGSSAKVGINTTTPGATLDVRGAANVQGLLTSPAAGTATSSGGKASQAYDLVASSFNSSTKAAVNQTFQWKAEAASNNTTTPSGTLNLLFGSGTASPTETGLNLSSKGLFTFATGQTFPGTGTITGVTTATGSGLTGGGTTGSLPLSLLKTCSTNQVLQWNGTTWACATIGGRGTITGVTAGTYLAGGGTSGNVTLDLNTTATDARYAQLGAADTFTQVLTINSASPNSLVATSSAPGGVAVVGSSTDTSASVKAGVFGVAAGPGGIGVEGSGALTGVLGFSGTTSTLFGKFPGVGVNGDTGVTAGIGVLATADNGHALFAKSNGGTTTAYFQNLGFGDIIEAFGPNGFAYIDSNGTVHATGGFTTGTAMQSSIDHPLDPSGKYLTHASIESSEMLNLYTGNAVLGADGSAAVPLPDWFTALNDDFRYQLTAIGGFAQLYIAEEITGNQFRIAGCRAGMKVSWQVTGVRHDDYAKAHPLAVESDKQGEERGHYLHPDAFGQPLEMGITAVHRAKLNAQHAAKPASAPAPVILKRLGVTNQVAR
jgi:hypothetical protein